MSEVHNIILVDSYRREHLKAARSLLLQGILESSKDYAQVVAALARVGEIRDCGDSHYVCMFGPSMSGDGGDVDSDHWRECIAMWKGDVLVNTDMTLDWSEILLKGSTTSLGETALQYSTKHEGGDIDR